MFPEHRRSRTETILMALLMIVVFGGMALIGLLDGWR